MTDKTSRCVRLLDLAAEEYRTVQEYRRIAEEDPDPEVRALFRQAAQDEERHFRQFLEMFRQGCEGA